MQRSFFIIVLDLRLIYLAGSRETHCQIFFVNCRSCEKLLSLLQQNEPVMTKKLFPHCIIIALMIQFSGCNQNNSKVHSELVKISAEMNQNSPVMVDDYTRLDSTAFSAVNDIIYYYTLMNHPDIKAFYNSRVAELKSTIKSQIKENPQFQYFRENSLSLQYVYRDSLGNQIDKIVISPKDYK